MKELQYHGTTYPMFWQLGDKYQTCIRHAWDWSFNRCRGKFSFADSFLFCSYTTKNAVAYTTFRTLRYEVKLPLKNTQMKMRRKRESINLRMKSMFPYLGTGPPHPLFFIQCDLLRILYFPCIPITNSTFCSHQRAGKQVEEKEEDDDDSDSDEEDNMEFSTVIGTTNNQTSNS